MSAAEEKALAQETADVDRGLELVRLIEAHKKELKAITVRLQARALKGTQEALKDAGREGTRYLAKGTGVEVPIIVTADCIAKSFADGSPAHARAESAAHGQLPKFYRKKTIWELLTKDGKKFREEAAAFLGDNAPDFIAACRSLDKHGIPKNGITIRWNGDEPDVENEEAEE
jgi:hypothetical protein